MRGSRSPRHWDSLKFRLTSILLPFFVLVMIAAVYQGRTSVDQAEQRRQLGIDFRADLAAADIDDAVVETADSLVDVASSPGIVAVLGAADTSGCSLVFKGPAPFAAGHLDILDRDGRVLCSSLDDSSAATYAGAPWLPGALLDPAVSGLVEDPASGHDVVVLTHPVQGQGVVAAFLDVEGLTPALSERLSGPIDTSFALAEPAADDASTGIGSEWLAATAPVPALGLQVRAWSDRPAATAEARAVNQQVLLYLLICFGLLLAVALVVYRGIARPIERLSSSVRGVVAGDLDAVPVSVSGPAEVVGLSADFAQLVKNVQTELAQRYEAEQARGEARAEREADAAMLRSIIQSTQSLVYVKDLDGHYLMANAAFSRATGRAEADILGRTDADISPAHAPKWAADDLRARSGMFELEEWVGDPGDRRCFESVKFPLHNGRGELYATGGVSLDVTERRRHTAVIAEARDAALAANAAKSTFLATMSHEIRTPMTAVIGMTDLLVHTDLSAHQRELVGTVQSSGDALLGVINNILDISKIESGELYLETAVIELPTEIEKCLDLVVAAASAKGLELVCYVDDSCPARVMGDVVRLRQILTNLLANAVKFTERGEVVLAVSAQDPGDGGSIAIGITVTDTGIGIPPESLDRLFKSFSQVDASMTRTYGGTGLGLVIARRLAEAMGGNVTVSSTLGEGSTFVVTLALQPCPDAGPIHEVGAPTADVLAGRSVLVVDDNRANLRALEVQVTRLRMVCTLADSAEVALALVAGGLAYDVALLDQRMPAVDGVALGRALRASAGPCAAAPQVLLTEVGWTPPGVDHEFDQVVTKPAKTLALGEALATALDGRQRGHAEAFGSAPAARTLRILVAEDHPVNQRVVELMLHELGHSVDIVADGNAAVDAIAACDYDVVLMDLQMPRMDGLEATRRVRASAASRSQPHIIAMTASTLVDDRLACQAAGMDSYLSKPVRAADLQAMLERTTAGAFGGGWAEAASDTTRAASSQLPAAVDPEVLDELMRGCGDVDGDLRRELIVDYLREGSGLITELLAAADAEDRARLTAAAHALRSPSALLGATVLAAMLAAAEQDDEDSRGGRARAGAIAAEYDRVADSLGRLMVPAEAGGDRALA